MRQIIKNQAGYTIVVAIMLIFLVSIVGLSLITLNTNSMKLSKNEEVDQAVYYAAEAGINYYIDQAHSIIKSTYDQQLVQYNNLSTIEKSKVSFINDYLLPELDDKLDIFKATETYPFPPVGALGNITAQVKITHQLANENIEISFTSTGIIDNKERTITQNLYAIKPPGEKKEIIINPQTGEEVTNDNNTPPPSNLGSLFVDDPDYPDETYVFANQYTISGGGKKIAQGSIKSKININEIISIQDFNEKFNIPENTKSISASKGMIIKEDTIVNGFIHLNNTSSKQNPTKINIDATNNDVTIYINDTFNPKHMVINITGNYNVNFVIKESVTFEDVSVEKLLNSNSEVNILIQGISFNINAGSNEQNRINANIIALNAPIIINNNKTKIDGNIISYSASDFRFEGSQHAYIYGLCAPNAKIFTNGQYKLNGGSMVVDHFVRQGGGSFDTTAPGDNSCTPPSIFQPDIIDTKKIEYLEYSSNPGSLYYLDTLLEN